MEEYLPGKVEGWGAAASDQIPESAEAFEGYSEEYVQGYMEGAREALENYGSQQAMLSGG